MAPDLSIVTFDNTDGSDVGLPSESNWLPAPKDDFAFDDAFVLAQGKRLEYLGRLVESSRS